MLPEGELSGLDIDFLTSEDALTLIERQGSVYQVTLHPHTAQSTLRLIPELERGLQMAGQLERFRAGLNIAAPGLVIKRDVNTAKSGTQIELGIFIGEKARILNGETPDMPDTDTEDTSLWYPGGYVKNFAGSPLTADIRTATLNLRSNEDFHSLRAFTLVSHLSIDSDLEGLSSRVDTALGSSDPINGIRQLVRFEKELQEVAPAM